MHHEKHPEHFQRLVDILKTLPGIGKRSAERMAFSMLKWPDDKLHETGNIISDLRRLITSCPDCHNLSTDGKPCTICSNPSRDKSLVCVIEESSQIFSIENCGHFKGIYHVLGGKLSPLELKGSQHLNIDTLKKKIDSGEVRELILALSNDVEGQATSIYISDILKGANISITRLAQGLPAGSDISFADAATIAAALFGRRPL